MALGTRNMSNAHFHFSPTTTEPSLGNAFLILLEKLVIHQIMIVIIAFLLSVRRLQKHVDVEL